MRKSLKNILYITLFAPSVLNSMDSLNSSQVSRELAVISSAHRNEIINLHHRFNKLSPSSSPLNSESIAKPLPAERKTNWNDLPTEIKLTVLSFLTNERDKLYSLCKFSLIGAEGILLAEEAFKHLLGEKEPLWNSSPTPWKMTYYFNERVFDYLKEYKIYGTIDLSETRCREKAKKLYQFCQDKNLPHASLLPYLCTPTLPKKRSLRGFIEDLKTSVKKRDIYALELFFLLHVMDITLYQYPHDPNPHRFYVDYDLLFLSESEEFPLMTKDLIEMGKSSFVFQKVTRYCSPDVINDLAAKLFVLAKRPPLGAEQLYKIGTSLIREAAERGHSLAQANLGVCYRDGRGIQRDLHQAYLWFLRAAESGDPSGQASLALCYHNGEGVARNLEMSVYWNKQAARNGHRIAQFNLANSYYDGSGIKKNITKAIKWYLNSAEQGLAVAQFKVGVYFERERDLDQAIHWLTKAALQGNADHQNYLGTIYATEMGDFGEAVKWAKLSAKQGNALAQNNLGRAYLEGKGVKQDMAKAAKWLRRAAEQGEVDAQYDLGVCYAFGKGVYQDYAKAAKWFRLAAQSGHKSAQFNLNSILTFVGNL